MEGGGGEVVSMARRWLELRQKNSRGEGMCKKTTTVLVSYKLVWPGPRYLPGYLLGGCFEHLVFIFFPPLVVLKTHAGYEAKPYPGGEARGRARSWLGLPHQRAEAGRNAGIVGLEVGWDCHTNRHKRGGGGVHNGATSRNCRLAITWVAN